MLLPAGKYTSHVTATDGDFTVSQGVGFEMNAFAITSSTSTPRRGHSITITAKPAEPGGSVTMSIFQPGKSAWTVKMTKLSSGSYRATVTLKTGGSAGTLKISVQAKDAKGNQQDLPETAALVGSRGRGLRGPVHAETAPRPSSSTSRPCLRAQIHLAGCRPARLRHRRAGRPSPTRN